MQAVFILVEKTILTWTETRRGARWTFLQSEPPKICAWDAANGFGRVLVGRASCSHRRQCSVIEDERLVDCLPRVTTRVVLMRLRISTSAQWWAGPGGIPMESMQHTLYISEYSTMTIRIESIKRHDAPGNRSRIIDPLLEYTAV